MGIQPTHLFGGTIKTLSTSLDLRSRNHELILGNIANADTPGYKPFRMDVEAAMQKEPVNPSTTALERTDEKHLPGNPPADGMAGHIERVEGNALLLRGDGNTVDMDAEMATLAKNSMLYRASAQIVSSKFKGLKNVISGGKQ
ncbi:MAG: flagellar basal body rod protein FlgB [Proteobacteria bacterium]|nr:MAG: flagellar basal body rod protein FlgB [Pseudomonadota bacterium]PIE67145.1 MAG: flagellar basal body rod protein FlgB [Deltaproteobacteria bacterium]